MSDKELLKKVYDYIGHENFIQLVDTLNGKCIDELGLKDSENCEKEPNDKRDICGECIANALKDLEFEVTRLSVFRTIVQWMDISKIIKNRRD